MLIWKVSYYNKQNQLVTEEKYFGTKEEAEAYATLSGPECSYYSVSEEYIQIRNIHSNDWLTHEQIEIKRAMQNLWIEKAAIILLGILFILALIYSIAGTFFLPAGVPGKEKSEANGSMTEAVDITIDISSFAWAKTFITTLSGVCIGILLKGRSSPGQDQITPSARDKKD